MENSSAIMQPYLFPYIGYMNLVYSSKNFVFLDDVNFIKKGWINRNVIRNQNNSLRFNVALKNISSNCQINHTLIENLDYFKKKFLKKIEHSYKNSINYDSTLSYIDEVLSIKTVNISELAINSVTKFFDRYNLSRNFYISSRDFPQTKELDKCERLVQITKELNTINYINMVGGESLYSKEEFKSKNVNLFFLCPEPIEYSQQSYPNFINNLSIIDLMMNVPDNLIKEHLKAFSIL